MKMIGKVVLGLLCTALFMTVILYVSDVPYVQYQTVSKPEGQASDKKLKPNSLTSNTQSEPNSLASNTQSEPNSLASNTQSEPNSLAGNTQPELNSLASNTQSEPNSLTDDAKSRQGTPKSRKTAKEKSRKTKDKRNTFQTVTQDYFSDAVFIGDSRTVGMQQSGLLPDAEFYAKTGIGIGNILTARIVFDNGAMISVEEALNCRSFGKVYIMIGINDMSSGDVEWFTKQYKKILTVVRQTQPDAVIYIQGNIPMSSDVQDETGSLNNANLALRNEASRSLADNKNIFYLEINEIFADADGSLSTYFTSDGLHVNTKHYPLWIDYLMHHGIIRQQ